MEKYDAIIVGASFAGLSVASQLKGKVLLIDKHDIGTVQISACGAPFDVIKEIGCGDSVLQISEFCSILNSRNQADLFERKSHRS